MRTRKLALAFFTALFVAFAARFSAAEPLKLRVGWILVPAEVTAIFPKEPKVAVHEGKSYVIESLRFQGSSLYTAALASGELDIAPFGYSSFGLAVQNANLGDLKIIADEDRDGYGGYFTTLYKVRKDSPIRQVEDLKGKVIATNSVGSISDMALRFLLRRHKVDDAKDVSFVEISLPNMTAVLLEQKADLIASVVPFSLDPNLLSASRTLFTGVDAMGPAEIAMMTAREKFLREHRAVVVDFLEDYLRVLRWYNDPTNRDAALRIVSSFMKLPPEKLSSWAFTKNDYYRDPHGRVDTAILQKNLAMQHELGYLKTPIDAKSYVDMSLMTEAEKRLQ